jgi:hypothetical protein
VLRFHAAIFDLDVSVYEDIALGTPLHMLASFNFQVGLFLPLLFEIRDFSKTLDSLSQKFSNLAK